MLAGIRLHPQPRKHGGILSMLDVEECERARLSRNPAHDGRFFTGVRTTRIGLSSAASAPTERGRKRHPSAPLGMAP